ncbi:SagB family peptide dehydrogenase [Streptomyces sp. ATCC51928]|uniref:SagB family peptide dehydrogenase n=2 Tax=Streptomyces TaxID=1883 RepID=A0ABW2MJ33_9ACTN|nr:MULTISPECIES: SagB family peptide dehydrogenase [unclassified Streptomyces]MDX3503603.1 SagB family peptide dehydrogenase [Streptomyces sp. ATCC51928]MDX5525318.1 SagB family peptide dehydrogenase [Streptomyces sp. DE06-01C]
MGYAHEYAAAIMYRGRVPMEPVDYVPNWQDGPRKAKFHPDTDGFPLPDAPYPPGASLDRGLFPEGGPGQGEFDLGTLSGMLRDSYGLTGRRLGVQANTDLNALPFYPLANWSRGSASGGGLYPVSIHWVSGPSGPVPPGVHYYSTRQHSMRRLLTGDVSGRVRDALGEDAPGPETDQYLVLGIKYWQNSFKYNSFSFHAVSMDLGACVQTWRMWAAARGLAVEPALWFDEERIAELLGVDPREEGIFAVVPLKWAGTDVSSGRSPAPAAPVSVRHKDVERSRTVLTFDALLRMQAATSADAAARPAPGALVPAAAHPADERLPEVALPAARPLDADVRTALRARRSSFGRFDARKPVTADQLAACLAAAAAGSRLGGDTGDVRLAKLYAFVGHVEGIEPGSYAYDPEARSLRRVKEGRPGEFLQKNYFLANYNLEQTGAVLVPTVRTTAVLDAVGDRGYRLVNATIGAVAQSVYTAAAAVDLGCGVALGFDNISYIEELGLEGTGEAPLLIMMIGNERPAPADFRYEIA